MSASIKQDKIRLSGDCHFDATHGRSYPLKAHGVSYYRIKRHRTGMLVGTEQAKLLPEN